MKNQNHRDVFPPRFSAVIASHLWRVKKPAEGDKKVEEGEKAWEIVGGVRKRGGKKDETMARMKRFGGWSV